MKKNFDVTGMTCSACSNRVEKAVSHVPGVEDVNVNLLKNSMTVDYDETKTGLEQIIQAVTDAGYGASEKQAAGSPAAKSVDSTPGGQKGSRTDEDSSVRFALFCGHPHDAGNGSDGRDAASGSHVRNKGCTDQCSDTVPFSSAGCLREFQVFHGRI